MNKQQSTVEETSASSFVEKSSPEISNSKWQDFKDSFKRADNISEVIEKSTQLNLSDVERANLGTTGEDLHRKLKNRHIQMIALGGSIGTGLLVGSGNALRLGGPAALLIAWGVVGTMVFCVVHALGELCVAFPVNGAFSTYATRFVDSSWGFAVGWNYAIMWLFVFPLELVAAAMCLQFWNTSINPVSWVVIFYVLIVSINLFGVKGYGEAEFYLTIFKIVALIGFIILGVILVCGGGPTHEFIGNKNWKIGAFANGFKGVATTFITASYSLAGTEMVGLAAAEVDNPRKVLPSAIRQVFWRVFLFFYLTLTFIGLLVPYNHPDLLGGSGNNASPFVIAIKDSGIKVLPSIFNACILFAVVSVGNSSVFGCSRTIQSMGAQGLAPQFFGYIDRKGRPLVALGISALFGALCFLTASRDQGAVFTWLLSVAGLATIFAWFNIALCHFRFRRAMRTQKRSLDELVFTSIAGIWGSLYSMAFLIVVLGVQFWVALFPLQGDGKPAVANATSFFQNYLGVFVIILFYIGHKLYTKNWRIYLKSEEIDLDTGRRIVDIEVLQAEMFEEKEENRSKPIYIRLWNYWC